MQDSAAAAVNWVVCEGPLYYKHKNSWHKKYAELIKCTEGYVHVLKICDKKGGKLRMEIKSQDINRIEVHSEDIRGENQLIFTILSSDTKNHLCLYSKTREEVSNWVASLLVAVSEGKLYHVKHYSDDSVSMQHSILYLTNAYDKGTDKTELTLILSSPLDGSRIRKSWKVNAIKQVIQLNAAIKLVFCQACCKSITENVSFEFILFAPSNNSTECLEFIFQNPCFALDSSGEEIISYKNIEHDKICSEKSQNTEDSIATNTTSDSCNDLGDDREGEVKDDHNFNQPEYQNTTQTMSTQHKNLLTDSSEEDTSTSQSGSSELKVSLPAERYRVHAYEEIPFSADTTHGVCQADNNSSAVQTPGTLHRNLVKPVKEDTSNDSTNLKLLPPRGSHFYEEIPNKTSENPVHVKGGHIYYEINSVAELSTESKPTTDEDISESTQKPSSKTNNVDTDKTLTSETCQSTSTEYRSTPILPPRRKKIDACTVPVSEPNQKSDDEKSETEPMGMSMMKPTPKPRKNVPSSSHNQDTELNEVDNHDEDQSNIRSDSTHEELKPVPKPRVGKTLSSNSDDTELNEVDNHDEDQSNIRSDSTHEELKPVPKPRVGRTPSSNSDEGNYTKLFPLYMDDYQQNNGGYVTIKPAVTPGSENNEKHKMN